MTRRIRRELIYWRLIFAKSHWKYRFYNDSIWSKFNVKRLKPDLSQTQQHKNPPPDSRPHHRRHRSLEFLLPETIKSEHYIQCSAHWHSQSWRASSIIKRGDWECRIFLPMHEGLFQGTPNSLSDYFRNKNCIYSKPRSSPQHKVAMLWEKLRHFTGVSPATINGGRPEMRWGKK